MSRCDDMESADGLVLTNTTLINSTFDGTVTFRESALISLARQVCPELAQCIADKVQDMLLNGELDLNSIQFEGISVRDISVEHMLTLSEEALGHLVARLCPALSNCIADRVNGGTFSSLILNSPAINGASFDEVSLLQIINYIKTPVVLDALALSLCSRMGACIKTNVEGNTFNDVTLNAPNLIAAVIRGADIDRTVFVDNIFKNGNSFQGEIIFDAAARDSVCTAVEACVKEWIDAAITVALIPIWDEIGNIKSDLADIFGRLTTAEDAIKDIQCLLSEGLPLLTCDGTPLNHRRIPTCEQMNLAIAAADIGGGGTGMIVSGDPDNTASIGTDGGIYVPMGLVGPAGKDGVDGISPAYTNCTGTVLANGASVATCADITALEGIDSAQEIRIAALEAAPPAVGLEYLNTTLDLSVMVSPVGATQFPTVIAAINYVLSHFVFGPLAKIRITDYRTGITEVLSFQSGSGVNLGMFIIINEGDVTYTVSGHGRLPMFKVNKLGTVVLHPGSELIIDKLSPGSEAGAALSITSLSMTGATLRILGELDGNFGDTKITVKSAFTVYDGSRIFSTGEWDIGTSVFSVTVSRSEFNNKGSVISNAPVFVQDDSRWYCDLLDVLNNKRPYVISSKARIGTLDVSGAAYQLSMTLGSRVACDSYNARGGIPPVSNTITSNGIFTVDFVLDAVLP